MKVFNLAEELEKERKKNKELKQELKEANESITWWTNRFNAIEKNNKELENRIDKAIEYIEETWKKESYYEDIENCVEFATINEIQKDRLLNLLGDNNE